VHLGRDCGPAQKQHFLRGLRLHTMLASLPKTGSKGRKYAQLSEAAQVAKSLQKVKLSSVGAPTKLLRKILDSPSQISLGHHHHRRHPLHPHAHDHQLRHRHEGGASLVTLTGDAHVHCALTIVHSPTMSPEKPQSPRPSLSPPSYLLE